MRIATATLASLLTAACATALHAQPPAQPAPRDPFILADTTEQIFTNIYVIPDKDTTSGVPNVGIIVGTHAALVIDPGLGFPNGAIVLAETLKLAPGRDLYIVSTHVHPEHDLGANAFPPSAKMIRSAAEVKDIDEFGLQTAKIFSSHSAVQAEMLQGATFRKADIVFDKDYTLDLGGIQVHLVAMGPNHTAGDTVMFVTPGRVLFAGDLAMIPQPSFASPYSSLAHWLTTLDALNALHPAILVPSHGPIGNASFIAGYRTYLTAIRDRTAALKKQGLTVEQVTATLTQQMSAAYPNTQRLAGAIQVAYKEAP